MSVKLATNVALLQSHESVRVAWRSSPIIRRARSRAAVFSLIMPAVTTKIRDSRPYQTARREIARFRAWFGRRLAKAAGR